MKRFFTAATVLALVLALGWNAPAFADGVGKIFAIVDQILGGHVDGAGATTGQALVKQSDGSWKPGTISTSFPVLAPDGTISAPTYSFANETGLGIYRFGAGSLSIAAGSANLAIFRSTANLGISLNADTTIAGTLLVNNPSITNAKIALDVPANATATSGTSIGGRFVPTFADGGTNSTTVAQALLVAPTIQYTGATKTGHYEALVISVTENPGAVPTGTNYLIRAQAGSAGSTDKFTVTNDGSTTLASGATLTLTGVTVAGAPTWSSNQAITLSTAAQPNVTSLGTLTGLTMGGTLTVGANTLALASATVSGAPTWSSNQAITLSTAAQTNVTSLGTLTALTMGGTLTMGANTLALATATVSGTPTWSSNQAITLSTASQPNITSLGTLTSLGTGTITLSDAANIVVGTTTGTQIGTGTTQKLGFYGATPVAQIAGSTDVLAGLVTQGFRAASSNPALNLGSGAITTGQVSGGASGSTLTINSASTSGGTGIAIQCGSTPSSLAGTSISITAGQGGNISGSTAGGAITLTGGIAGAPNGAGGNVTIKGGPSAGSSGTTTVGGDATIQGGGVSASDTSPTPGNAKVIGGAALNTFTNQVGGNAVVSAGTPTGNASSDVVIQSGFIGASGSTLQTLYDRQRITSKTKALSTTTATNTVFANLSNAVTDTGVGCTVTGTIELIDGTHHVGAIHFTVPFSSVNQNGTLTTGVVPVISTANGSIDTGGTYTSLTTTFTLAASGTNLQLGVTPSWAAGTPTTVRLTYQVIVNGPGNVAPQ